FRFWTILPPELICLKAPRRNCARCPVDAFASAQADRLGAVAGALLLQIRQCLNHPQSTFSTEKDARYMIRLVRTARCGIAALGALASRIRAAAFRLWISWWRLRS